MKINQLGKGGPFVTELGLGTMTFGVETEAAEAHRQLDAYVAAGGNFIDTADVYGAGRSETIIGEWLNTNDREDLIIATKVRFAPPAGSSGASRRGILKAFEGSLRRLQLDSVDLLYVHGWDPDADLDDTLSTLTDLVASGKVHSIGWSNTSGWQLQRILDSAERNGYVRPVVFQPQYNLLDRTIEWELLPLCLDIGLAVVPWSPLGGGWLTGKYSRDTPPTGATRLGEDPNRGVEAYAKRNVDRVWDILTQAESVAATDGVWLGEVALRWLLDRPGVASVLLGARTEAQLLQSLAAAEYEMASVQHDRLTAASAPGIPDYPYGMLSKACGVDVWDQLGTVRPPAI